MLFLGLIAPFTFASGSRTRSEWNRYSSFQEVRALFRKVNDERNEIFSPDAWVPVEKGRLPEKQEASYFLLSGTVTRTTSATSDCCLYPIPPP